MQHASRLEELRAEIRELDAQIATCDNVIKSTEAAMHAKQDEADGHCRQRQLLEAQLKEVRRNSGSGPSVAGASNAPHANAPPAAVPSAFAAAAAAAIRNGGANGGANGGGAAAAGAAAAGAAKPRAGGASKKRPRATSLGGDKAAALPRPAGSGKRRQSSNAAIPSASASASASAPVAAQVVVGGGAAAPPPRVPSGESDAGSSDSHGAGAGAAASGGVAGPPVMSRTGIYAPSADEALVAAMDDTMYTPCYILHNFRQRLIDDTRHTPPPKPGEVPSTPVTKYLLSREGGGAGIDRPVNGFIMWVESYGKRRGGFTAEIKLLSYRGEANIVLGRELVEEMEQRLAAACDIDVKFEKRLTPPLVATWRELGFNGMAGSQAMQRSFMGVKP